MLGPFFAFRHLPLKVKKVFTKKYASSPAGPKTNAQPLGSYEQEKLQCQPEVVIGLREEL
jgi:hypothetical protein